MTIQLIETTEKRRRLLVSVLVLMIVSQVGCAYRYANVYVKTVGKSSQTAVAMEMYNGVSGLHLGQTGDTLYLKRRARTTYPPLSLIVRGGIDGCPTYWKIVKVENWAASPKEAGDATKKNDVLFIVNDGDEDCHR